MSNAYNDNDRRLKQDTAERKDKENTNAGMIGGIVILLIGLAGLYLYYTYEAPIADEVAPTAVSQPATVTPVNTAPTTTTSNQ